MAEAAKAAKNASVKEKGETVVEDKTTVTESAAPQASAEKPAENAVKTRWYVIQTQSNYEKRVQSQVREKVIIHGLEKLVEDILIPTEEVVEVKKGAKTTSERKFFPGYVLVKCAMTDEVWHIIRSTSHVTGFVGAERGKKPIPISQAEAERILNQMEEGVDRPRPMVSFDIGEEVRVTEGPFSSFQGIVEEIDEGRSRIKVSVSIFGRATPIELEFTQVEKI